MPNLPNLPNLPNGANMSNVATDLLDAADKHVPTLGLNARRKFFHGLAVVMFVPGVAIDPAFTHLSFSAAFALFTFAEYVRYFAIYPFGAAVHLFMNEFLDHKDSGTAILSHFYLLTGCAGSLWLEGPSMLLQFTGILTLGLGDAAASIVGRRLGIHRWSPTSSKTVEGSLAFVASVFTAALLLRLVGVVEAFSNVRYLFVAAISAVLEALSDQNDNLTLPLYMWSSASEGAERRMSGRDGWGDVEQPSSPVRPLLSSPLLVYVAIHRLPLDRQHPQSIPPQPFSERPRATGYMVQKRSISRKLNRPSTAPAGDAQVILPSVSSGQANTAGELSSERSSSADGAFPNLSEPKFTHRDAVYAMHTLLEDDADFPSGSLEQPRTTVSLRGANLPTTIAGDNLSSSDKTDYDWATFITAYSIGRWDPHKTPNPPRSCQHLSETFRRFPLAEPAKIVDQETVEPLSSKSLTDLPKGTPENIVPGSSNKIGERPSGVSFPPSSSDLNASPTVPHKPRPPFPLQLVLPAHRMRNSISTSFPNSSANQPSSSSISNVDVHATVATMRWAAARVDISPLALPSPEHELTDPMRGVTATIPGSHSKESNLNNDYAITPGGTRRSRLSDFWEGTTDIENGATGLSQLATVQASPSDPVADRKAVEDLHPNGDTSTIPVQNPVSLPAPTNASLSLLVAPPATAPVLQEARSTPMVTTDYFGDVRPAIQASVNPPQPPPISAPLSAPSTQVLMRTDNAIPESGASTVPALPRRLCLTRQTSSC
ncbi:hypothetical protein NLJ89_g3256 [Agrocybe chaxingu]|uniref:dolichol kinase n=1 Tax=Agrocybe chaxingu TaxID=84603 RepID=A0A9W8KA47_9AGAR|nr:hypothetical protein NLJ89_g3256 [Agrocybe chaxingu]